MCCQYFFVFIRFCSLVRSYASWADTGSYSYDREVTVEAKLEHTDRPYVVVPSSFEPDQEKAFSLVARCEFQIEFFRPGQRVEGKSQLI